MMRSLYSAVSGLKTHQTKMDVIGNNIANVNTVAFKSTSVTFSTIMYQTLSGASGANAEQGLGGVNAKQIGLGVSMASTQASITSAGAAETTGRAFDLKVTDNSSSSFFIVNNGSENVFTKAGSFYVDGAGNLCMTSTGYTVMGWQVDPSTGDIRKDTVSPLKIMSAENQTSAPEATTDARVTGVVDNNSKTVSSDQGYVMNLTVYDNLGYPYTARFAIKAEDATAGEYTVNLTDIIDTNGQSILDSNIYLRSLFGTGSTNSTQGSGIDITDNYNFATGKSKSDIRDTIIDANTLVDDTTTSSRELTYILDAADVNEQLQLSGSKALPEGYTVRFTSQSTNLGSLKDGTGALGELTDASNPVTVYNAAGNPVAQGTYTRSTTNVTSGGTTLQSVDSGTWSFVELDENGAVPATPTATSYSPLSKTVNITDFLSLGAQVSDTTGEYNGYVFEGDALAELAEALNMDPDQPPFSNNYALYYWDPADLALATANSGSGIAVDGITDTVNGTGYFTDETSYVLGSGAPTAVTGLEYSYGIENEGITGNYAYTTIDGATMKSYTANDPIFTEELPADAVIKYSMFNGSWNIETPATDGFAIKFNTTDGTLSYIGNAGNYTETLNLSQLTRAGYDGFEDVTIDFSQLLNYNNNGSSTAAMAGGDEEDGSGRGKKLGALTGLSVDTSGKIFGSYNNGNTVLLGQIAVAQFANAAGLESTGDNCYRTTLNSGEFDGIGVEITADGSSISTGELEMSNVDLAGEFTSMITTQRGFQANSRVITTSDSMLEELINLKR